MLAQFPLLLFLSPDFIAFLLGRRGVFIRPSSVANGVIHLLNKSHNLFPLSPLLTSQLDPISVWAKNMTVASNWEMDSSPRQQDHVVRSLAHIFLCWPLQFHIMAEGCSWNLSANPDVIQNVEF